VGAFVDRIAAGLLTTPEAIAEFARGYESAGCDDLVLFPTVPELEQLERLADVISPLLAGVAQSASSRAPDAATD
jgi:hypothetical protein